MTKQEAQTMFKLILYNITYIILFRFIADCTEKTLDAYLWAASEYDTSDQASSIIFYLASYLIFYLDAYAHNQLTLQNFL